MGDCIHKRTVYYDNAGGVVRPLDWASVVTDLGTMWEPRQSIFPEFSEGAAVDFTDEITRVDELVQIDADRLPLIMSGDTMPTIGGSLTLRDGR